MLKGDRKEEEDDTLPSAGTVNRLSPMYPASAEEDSMIAKATLQGVHLKQYVIPAPHRQALQLSLGRNQFLFRKDDFYVSFTSFLHFLPPVLQLSKSVVETNR